MAALELTFAGFGGQQLAPEEIRERVRVRFPAVPELPQRPALDALVTQAGLGLTFDDRLRVYRATQPGSATTGLESRRPTTPGGDDVAGRQHGRARRTAGGVARERSFLALGVRADRLSQFVTAAQARYGATVVDLTGVLLDALRAASAAVGLSWELVRAADAEGEASRGRRGLDELVRRAWPDVEAAVEQALADGDPTRRLCSPDAAPLARYDNMGCWPGGRTLPHPRAGRCGWSCRSSAATRAPSSTVGPCRWRRRTSSCAGHRLDRRAAASGRPAEKEF